MTRVLVDGRALTDPRSRDRGIGRYVRSLLDAMAGLDAAGVRVAATRRDAVPEGLGFVRCGAVVPSQAPLLGNLFDRVSVREHRARLGALLRREHPDVFHAPAPDPAPAAAGPWVQTVHDLTPLVAGAELSPAEREAWLWRLRPAAAATLVIAPSASTADDAARVLAIPRERFRVIPHGVSPAFAPGPARPARDRPYLLYVGRWGAHKGLREAFAVIDRVAAAGEPHRLVVVGGVGAEESGPLRRLLEACAARDRVDLAGHVPEAALADLYRGATALVFSSRYEGFGLPLLEAMASGTAVVAFANSSVPEVLGEAGSIVPDGDVEAMAAAVLEVAGSDERRAALGRMGRARAAGFTWERSAAAHLDVYAEAATSRTG